MQRLHPLNFPAVWLWSLFVSVKYWRSEYLPQRWLTRLGVLDPADYFSVEDWHRAMEDAFLAWRRNVSAASWTIGGLSVEFARSWQQWLAIQFEERYLFSEMLRRARHPKSIETGRGFALLDRLWLGVLALGKTVRQARALFRRAGPADAGRCSIFWTDISSNEVPLADQRLSFYFAVERNLIDPRDCIYFLGAPPPDAAVERMRRFGVRWTTVAAFGFLPIGVKLRALAALFGVAWRGLLGCFKGARHFVLWRYAAESVPWLFAAQALGCRVYLTSVSSSWPEPAQVDALRTLAVRTINWSYGANTFCFSVRDPAFRDLALLRSVSVASEVWVWSDEVEHWLRARSLGAPPAIRVIGPVMSGDSRWLARTPSAARAAFGLAEVPRRKIVAVFDVPPVNRQMRLAIGHGPSVYPPAMLEQFFRDIEGLLELPDVTLLVKPKRSLSDSRRDFADSMQRILDPASDQRRAGRVVAVPHDIDPYIPVALADLCIGVPFTSPVVVGLGSGRPGLFHDPLGDVVRVPGAPALMAHVTHSAQELRERVAALLSSAHRPQSLRDAAEVFAGLLLVTESGSARPSINR